MICSICNGEVIWKGKFSNLSHTECQSCGAKNCQIISDEDEVAQREQEEWDALGADY